MKPFDLKAAKAGAPVCTRDGRKVRIICFNKESEYYPIVALVTYYNPKNREYTMEYTKEGRYYINNVHENDLMMATQKKEGWINIYPMIDEKAIAETGHHIYETKEFAKFYAMQNVIATVKIEWEE